jgi:hypothetical protein
MTIARIISIGAVVTFALAVGIVTFDPTYAGAPCCTIQNGVWIVTKTGKPASPAQIRTMGTSSQPSAPIKADTPKTGSGAPVSPSPSGSDGGYK